MSFEKPLKITSDPSGQSTKEKKKSKQQEKQTKTNISIAPFKNWKPKRVVSFERALLFWGQLLPFGLKMRVRCVVRTCKNASYNKDSHCSFHDFPANKELSQKWVAQITKYEEFCGWIPNVATKLTEYTKICSEHFDKTCFHQLGKKKRLLPSAVPTLFPRPNISVNISGNSSVSNSHNLEKEGAQIPESTEDIPDSDHTYGKRVVEPSVVEPSKTQQQMSELQPNKALQLPDSVADQDDDVVFLPSPKGRTQPLSTTPPRAPYDLTGRINLPCKRLPVSKPAYILPVPTSAGNQPLVTHIAEQQKELFLNTSLVRLREHTARFAYHTQPCDALQLSSSAESNDVTPSKIARVDPPSVTSLSKAPYDLTGRMAEESQQQIIPVNRIPEIPAPNPAVTSPLPTSINNQGFIIYVPQPIFTFPAPIITTIPSSNNNCYQLSTPVASSSVVASETVTQNGQVQQQQLPEERLVESNPVACEPIPEKEKTVSKASYDRRDASYKNQVKMVRKLRNRIQQMERAHERLLNTVGFALFERTKKDARVKRLFRSIEAILSGDENGEDHPAFLIDQILNFNATTLSKAKYSQASMRSCLALHAKSSTTYDFIRNQGVLILPSRNTLVSHSRKSSATQNDDVEDEVVENDVLADAVLSLQTDETMA